MPRFPLPHTRRARLLTLGVVVVLRGWMSSQRRAVEEVSAGRPLAAEPGRPSALNGEITRLATMVAYIDDFKLMIIITIACMPMLLLMRKPRKRGAEPVHAVAEH